MLIEILSKGLKDGLFSRMQRGANNDDFLPIGRIVSHEIEITEEKAAVEEERKEVSDRTNRLEAFTDLAKILCNGLRTKFHSLDSE